MLVSTLKVSEAAAAIGVSSSTLYQLVATRKIAHLRLGTGRGAIRFTKQQIEDYLQDCRVEPARAPVMLACKLNHLQVNHA